MSQVSASGHSPNNDTAIGRSGLRLSFTGDNGRAGEGGRRGAERGWCSVPLCRQGGATELVVRNNSIAELMGISPSIFMMESAENRFGNHL
jgi:hypothetical protein